MHPAMSGDRNDRAGAGGNPRKSAAKRLNCTKTAVTLLVTRTALFRIRAPGSRTSQVSLISGLPGTPDAPVDHAGKAADRRAARLLLQDLQHRRPPAPGNPEGQPGDPRPGQTEGPQRGERDQPRVRTLKAGPGQTPRSRTSRTMNGNRTASSRRRPGLPGKEPATTQDGVPDTDRSHPRHKSGRHRRRSRNRQRGGTEGRRDPVRPRARRESTFRNTFNNTGRDGHCGSPRTSRRRHGKGQNRRTGALPRESHAEDARESRAPRRNPGRTRGGHADRLAADPLTGKSPPLSHTS